MDTTETPATIVERDGGLVTFTLNRPGKKNAIDAAIWNDLAEVLTELETDPGARALVLTGAGGNFSSGADLSGGMSGGESKGLTGKGAQPILSEMRIVGDLVGRLQRLPKPTIAAVDGVAVGVALGLVLACDLVLASDRARFSQIFVKRGLALDGGTSWSLPQQIGLRRAKQMAFFGDSVDAPTALEWGLVNEVAAPEELQAMAADWGRRLATGPTIALSLIKRLLDDSNEASFHSALEGEARSQHVVFGTEDMKEGIVAFLERREPEFKGC
ncbi:MAG: enoyl-CoA hydratase/isomerase family protein [Microthrixaceae bacterium]